MAAQPSLVAVTVSGGAGGTWIISNQEAGGSSNNYGSPMAYLISTGTAGELSSWTSGAGGNPFAANMTPSKKPQGQP